MHRWIGLSLCLMLLCGCTAEESPETTETVPPTMGSVPGTVNTVGVEPSQPQEEELREIGDYWLPMDNSTGMQKMGENYLLLSPESWILLGEDNMKSVLRADAVVSDSSQVWTRENGVACYDAEEKDLIFLDNTLEEMGRLHMPEEVVGKVCLTQDWSAVYYCTRDSVRVLDMTTGISRTLKEQTRNWLSVDACMLDPAVLRCTAESEDGEKYSLLISTVTGEVLAQIDAQCTFSGLGDRYFISWGEEWICGQIGSQACSFLPQEGVEECYPVPEYGGVVTLSRGEEEICLTYYDLVSGRQIHRLSLEGDGFHWIWSDAESIWICQGERLYRWIPALADCGDETVYVQIRQTREDPYEAGLEEIGLRIEELEQQFDVRILFWEEVLEVIPESYQVETEYHTQVYEEVLQNLEEILGLFPTELLALAPDWIEEETLNIVLVQKITVASPAFAETESLLLQQDGAVYIVLQTETDLMSAFCHQLAHVMETPILSNSTAYYEWNDLNPSGFSYDNDYIANQDRQDTRYLEGNNRAFIDLFSMSYAKEDRCRIFEYACQTGNEAFFSSATMQKKLSRICTGIRTTFGLSGDPGSYIWEQYLQ